MKNYSRNDDEEALDCRAFDLQALDIFDAITSGQIPDPADAPTEPDWRNAVSRRILQVTDEDENIVPEFISIDKIPLFKR